MKTTENTLRNLSELLGFGKAVEKLIRDGALKKLPKLNLSELVEVARAFDRERQTMPTDLRQELLQAVSEKLKAAQSFESCQEIFSCLSFLVMWNLDDELTEMIFQRIAELAEAEEDLIFVSNRAIVGGKSEILASTKLIAITKSFDAIIKLLRKVNNKRLLVVLAKSARESAKTITESREILASILPEPPPGKMIPGFGLHAESVASGFAAINNGEIIKLALETHLNFCRSFEETLAAAEWLANLRRTVNPIPLIPTEPKFPLPWIFDLWQRLDGKLRRLAKTGDQWGQLFDLAWGEKSLEELARLAWTKTLKRQDTSIGMVWSLFSRTDHFPKLARKAGIDPQAMRDKAFRQAKCFADWQIICCRGAVRNWEEAITKLASLAKGLEECQEVRRKIGSSDRFQSILARVVSKQIKLSKTRAQVKEAVDGLPTGEDWAEPLIREALRKLKKLKN